MRLGLYTALLFLGVQTPVRAKLTAYDDGGMYIKMEDVPASVEFGPRIGKEGITGRLKTPKTDIFGCSEVDFETAGNAVISPEQLPTIALISRSIPHDPNACTFETKVRNAQRAGAGAVIVFDFIEEPPFHMQRETPGTSGINIPSVLVTQSSGTKLQELIAACTNPEGPLVFIDNVDPFEAIFLSLNMTLVGVLSGLILVLLLCGSVFLCTSQRMLRRYEAIGGPTRPMSESEVARLPQITVEAEMRWVKETCSVCLEEYAEGDVIIELPCEHGFHPTCISPWLVERQRTCPLCKATVTVPSVSHTSYPREAEQVQPRRPGGSVLFNFAHSNLCQALDLMWDSPSHRTLRIWNREKE
ncbi:unnamed protein product [Chrysoparadoxa australica]